MPTEQTQPQIVVGVDGSALSYEALRWADRYAKAVNGHISVLVTWEWPVMYGASVPFVDLDLAGDAQVVADKAMTEIHLASDHAKSIVVEGSSGPRLVEQSKNSDLLVVGARGHSAIAEAWLGSTSAYCIHHSTVPVVVVR